MLGGLLTDLLRSRVVFTYRMIGISKTQEHHDLSPRSPQPADAQFLKDRAKIPTLRDLPVHLRSPPSLIVSSRNVPPARCRESLELPPSVLVSLHSKEILAQRDLVRPWFLFRQLLLAKCVSLRPHVGRRICLHGSMGTRRKTERSRAMDRSDVCAQLVV